jgi:ribosomal protein S18 acetylase RimI-like enzyme
MIEIRTMSISDYEAVFRLFSETPGIAVRDADSHESTRRYLERNPGLSFVATDRGRVVGCILCGHDGRRGYLQHLVVSPPFRRQRIAERLVSQCVEALRRLGIKKSHVDVMVGNPDGQAFWEGMGWQKRDDLLRYSHISEGGPDA